MIYLLEDDNSIREFVIYTLNSQGLEAQGFERPSAFWAALEQRLPSLVLLDIMLPEEDGLSVLKRLRSATAAFPSSCSRQKALSLTKWWAWTAAQTTTFPNLSA